MPLQLSSLVKQIDTFGDSVAFNIKGNTRYPTWPGAILTVLIYFLIISYGLEKFTTMIYYGDTSFQLSTNRLQDDRISRDLTADDVEFDVAINLYRHDNVTG